MKHLVSAIAIALVALAGATGERARAQTIGEPIFLGGDVRADTFINTQALSDVSVVRLAGGNFVIAYQHRETSTSQDHVYFRRFQPNGTPLDVSEVRVDTLASTTFGARYPHIAALANGGFVVVFEVDAGIYARRFAASGAAIDIAEMRVNAANTSGFHPFVAGLTLGGFAVAWTSPSGVRARAFDVSGVPYYGGTRVSAAPDNGQGMVGIAGLGGNRFAVAWTDRVGNPQLANRHVFLRRFRSNGVALDASDVPLSTTFRRVNGGGPNGLASLRLGAMAAVWGSGSVNDPPPKVAYIRRLDAQANLLDGSEDFVSGGASDWHDQPSIARLDDTDYVVTWNAVGDGLYVRRVLADGSSSNAVGYRVSPQALTYDSGASASTPSGSLTWIAWSGGPGRVAYFRRARLKGAPVAREDVASTDFGQPIAIDVLANDADPDPKDELTIISVQATAGTARIEDGQVIYEPPHNCGETSDLILYEIRDLQGNTAQGKVNVTINQTPYMRVTPAGLAELYGAEGGPFPEPWGTYTVRNDGCGPMDWVAGRSVNWLVRTPASGTLAAGASVNVTLRAAGANANALPAGLHTGVARFRNQTNQVGNANRTVRLTVVPDWGHNAIGQAPVLSGVSGTTWSSNVNANGQPNEPDHAGVSQPLASVWWQWTAPQSGTAVFGTDGSSFDTTLAVYTGGPNPALLTEIASNEYFGIFGTRSRVVFQAVAGTTYRIAVDGKGAETGRVKLSWSMP